MRNLRHLHVDFEEFGLSIFNKMRLAKVLQKSGAFAMSFALRSPPIRNRIIIAVGR